MSTPPPPIPTNEIEILKYKVSYDIQKKQGSIEIYYHELEKRIQSGKISIVKTVKTRILEGDLLEMLFILDLLRNEKVLLFFDDKKEPKLLKTIAKESG
ncbi:MAG: hypothetical protein HWN66_06970 [Candidatus Helarchaeota archaeon]|nr:hypothetical protein [Candidatus Helarchaeota archaeon]